MAHFMTDREFGALEDAHYDALFDEYTENLYGNQNEVVPEFVKTFKLDTEEAEAAATTLGYTVDEILSSDDTSLIHEFVDLLNGEEIYFDAYNFGEYNDLLEIYRAAEPRWC